MIDSKKKALAGAAILAAVAFIYLRDKQPEEEEEEEEKQNRRRIAMPDGVYDAELDGVSYYFPAEGSVSFPQTPTPSFTKFFQVPETLDAHGMMPTPTPKKQVHTGYGASYAVAESISMDGVTAVVKKSPAFMKYMPTLSSYTRGFVSVQESPAERTTITQTPTREPGITAGYKHRGTAGTSKKSSASTVGKASSSSVRKARATARHTAARKKRMAKK